MKLISTFFFSMLVITFSFQANADTVNTEAKCGPSPIIKDSSITRTVKEEANKLNVDSGNITTTIVQSYTDSLNKYKNADKVLASTYYQYQICVLIMNSNLSTSQKQDAIKDALNVINDMGKEWFQVVLSPDIDSFIEPSIKNTDLYYMWRIEYRLDTKYKKNTYIINDIRIDDNIPPKEFEMTEGNYTIKMSYDIGLENSDTPNLEGTCAIPFKLDKNIILRPVISINLDTVQGSGLAAKCELNTG
ncbi:hypothetical protein ACHQI3_15765 [Raoultella planticola]|uniref:hypothetical protein n=1 Tax=Raoultella planticola TaxID=575 RepID=UPI00062BACCD|nr:hypothetical protein [Raoultella planticola]